MHSMFFQNTEQGPASSRTSLELRALVPQNPTSSISSSQTLPGSSLPAAEASLLSEQGSLCTASVILKPRGSASSMQATELTGLAQVERGSPEDHCAALKLQEARDACFLSCGLGQLPTRAYALRKTFETFWHPFKYWPWMAKWATGEFRHRGVEQELNRSHSWGTRMQIYLGVHRRTSSSLL